MCMMCEQEAMYQAYLEYLARKQAEEGEPKPAESQSPQASGFACDPAPDDESTDTVPAAGSKAN